MPALATVLGASVGVAITCFKNSLVYLPPYRQAAAAFGRQCVGDLCRCQGSLLLAEGGMGGLECTKAFSTCSLWLFYHPYFSTVHSCNARPSQPCRCAPDTPWLHRTSVCSIVCPSPPGHFEPVLTLDLAPSVALALTGSPGSTWQWALQAPMLPTGLWRWRTR